MKSQYKFATFALLLLFVVTFAQQAIADGMELKLSRASVPANIPLHKGMFDGKSIHYIITDANEKEHADIITKQQGWRVELAPLLSHTPKASLEKVYLFTNGIKGSGIHGYQDEVFSSTPAQRDRYSAIRSVVHVKWRMFKSAMSLDSEEAIMAAKRDGKVKLEQSDVIVNMPQVVWPGGQLPVKEDKQLSDNTAYGKAQLLDIDLKQMQATFVAHRGWGPDGRTIYYIVTDTAPSGPSKMMGVVHAPTVAMTIDSPAAVDLYQFKNGIKGTGPMGFQAGIASSGPGDANYSPLWRINMIVWNNPELATVLETMDDIFSKQGVGAIKVDLARPMNSDHVVNCPFIDPFQNI